MFNERNFPAGLFEFVVYNSDSTFGHRNQNSEFSFPWDSCYCSGISQFARIYWSMERRGHCVVHSRRILVILTQVLQTYRIHHNRESEKERERESLEGRYSTTFKAYQILKHMSLTSIRRNIEIHAISFNGERVESTGFVKIVGSRWDRMPIVAHPERHRIQRAGNEWMWKMFV